MTLILILLIIILTAASALFSLSEIAFFSLPSSRVKAYRYSLDQRKREIARLLKESQSLLVTIFLLNTIVNILVQNITSDLFESMHDNWLFKVGVPLVLILVFGELLPKYLGLIYNEQIALKITPFYDWFQNISRPIRISLTHIANFFSRILFFYLKIEKPLSEDELKHILHTSQGLGLVHKEEVTLLKGYLSFEEKRAVDVMMPKSDMPFYDIELPLSKLIYIFQEKEFSVVPICQGSIDHFLGMIDAKQFFVNRDGINQPSDLLKLLYKPFFVPETTSLKFLLSRFESQGRHIAVIIDEYGAISGMIRKSDLLAELFEPTKAALKNKKYSSVGKNSIIASGTMPLDEVSELFQVALESTYHQVTIGGYLTEKLGTIPLNGVTYKSGSLFFRILSSDATHIRRVYIQLQLEEGQGSAKIK